MFRIVIFTVVISVYILFSRSLNIDKVEKKLNNVGRRTRHTRPINPRPLQNQSRQPQKRKKGGIIDISAANQIKVKPTR